MSSSASQKPTLTVPTFIPESSIRRASTGTFTFLTLSPTLSASHPVRKATPPPTPKTAESTTSEDPIVDDVTAAIPVGPSAQEIEAEIKHRRSSSSAASDTSRRFLKLGPVHWGENDGTGDWSEMSIAE